MKVSILIPVFGVEKYIERCAISLFEQTYENLEFIFVNDCTPDRSIEKILQILKSYPNRKSQVRIIQHNENKGLGEARNSAVQNASGDFIYHVDSDDFIDKECIRMCVNKQIETDADIVSVYISQLEKNKTITKKTIHTSSPKELNHSIITHTTPNNIWGRLIRRKLYTDNRIHVPKGINMSEDLNVLPRLLYFAQTVAFIPKELHYYECRNSNSYTASFSEDKFFQEQATFDYLKFFFKDRDYNLLKSVEIREYSFLVRSLCGCVKKGGNKKTYMDIRHIINERFPNFKTPLGTSFKIALKLEPYLLFTIYIRLGTAIKKLIIG